MSDVRTYNSRLRQEQAEATRERILDATAGIYEEEGRLEAATVRAVAARAGVREITVYRHFPNREVLLNGLWERLNRGAGVTVGFPDSPDDLVAKLGPLFDSFDAAPAHVLASLRTEEGLKVRSSLNEDRRAHFLKLLAEAAPDLPPAEAAKAAAMLQLIYSGYAWVSMREQWDLPGPVAADAAAWAAEILIDNLRQRGARPIRPGGAIATSRPIRPRGGGAQGEES